MIPQLIDVETDPCELARKWTLDPRLAFKLKDLAVALPFSISIISGYRTPEEQMGLLEEGRPAAPVGLSTHCSCPATGADLWPGVEPAGQIKLEFGRQVRLVGLRWGGGSPTDENGIPSDWNHVDMGPRAR